MPTRTEHTHQVTQIEVVMEASYTNFTRAFESLLGRMPVEALSGLPSLSAQAACEQLASYVGPLDFTLFQKLDHGAIVRALARCQDLCAVLLHRRRSRLAVAVRRRGPRREPRRRSEKALLPSTPSTSG